MGLYYGTKMVGFQRYTAEKDENNPKMMILWSFLKANVHQQAFPCSPGITLMLCKVAGLDCRSGSR